MCKDGGKGTGLGPPRDHCRADPTVRVGWPGSVDGPLFQGAPEYIFFFFFCHLQLLTFSRSLAPSSRALVKPKSGGVGNTAPGTCQLVHSFPSVSTMTSCNSHNRGKLASQFGFWLPDEATVSKRLSDQSKVTQPEASKLRIEA